MSGPAAEGTPARGEQQPLISEAASMTKRGHMHPSLQKTGSAHLVAELSPRFRAPALLFFGAATCILGFAFVTLIGIIEFLLLTGNKSLGIETYPSGYGYFPATMSEMVYNQDSPGGKIFHTFGIMSGMCIFMSWYPLHLRNVYTGKHHLPLLQNCGLTIYWTTARQILPAMGLYLLIGVNTYPTPIAEASAGHTKFGCVVLHLMGAGMMFVGYLVCEMKCIGLSIEDKGPCAAIQDRERIVRRILAYIILVSFGSFCLLQVALVTVKHLDMTKEDQPFCCADQWLLKGDKHGDVTITDEPQINNTASGGYLYLKIASFCSEDIAGLALVISHLVVWYYCDERQYFYGEFELEDVNDLQEPTKPP